MDEVDAEPSDPLAAAVDSYLPRDDGEEEAVRRLRDLIRRGEAWSRRQPLHVTASVLVVDPAARRVLLRWHTRMRRWMQVGGHADREEQDPWLVACREAQEETGLSDLTALTPAVERQPVQIVIVPVPAHGDEDAHEHVDVRYVLRTAEPDRAVAESADAHIRWIDLAEAEEHIEEENLREFVRRVNELVVE